MNELISGVLTRRGSLGALGIVGLNAFALPIAASAKKNHKQNQRKKKRVTVVPATVVPAMVDPDALCQTQGAQCTTFFTAACKGDPACLAKVFQCCPLLDSCQFSSAIACLSAP